MQNEARSAPRKQSLNQYFELLRRRPAFRNLWLGATVSLAGDWFSLIALYTLLQDYTGSGEAIGLMLAARWLPAVFFGPLTGVVADRFSRRRVMVICDLLRMIAVLGFLLVRSKDDVWLVYVLTFVQMTMTAFFEPAEQASIAGTVGRDEIVTANTLHAATWSAMLGVGAVLGGLVAAHLGRDAAFAIDALSYGLSAIFISRSAIPFIPPTSPHTVRQAATDFFAGLSLLKSEPRVRRALWVKSGWAIAGGGAILLYPVMGERTFAGSGSVPLAIGVLLGMRGVGAFLGPLIARRLGGDSEAFLQRAISLSFFSTMIFWVGFAWSPNLAVAALLLTFAHFGVSTQWVFSSSLINLWVKDEFRGRVFGLDFMLYTLVLAISAWGTGALLDRTGANPRVLMTILAGLLLVTQFGWWWLKPAEPLKVEVEAKGAG
jgi:MFS family permease